MLLSAIVIIWALVSWWQLFHTSCLPPLRPVPPLPLLCPFNHSLLLQAESRVLEHLHWLCCFIIFIILSFLSNSLCVHGDSQTQNKTGTLVRGRYETSWCFIILISWAINCGRDHFSGSHKHWGVRVNGFIVLCLSDCLRYFFRYNSLTCPLALWLVLAAWFPAHLLSALSLPEIWLKPHFNPTWTPQDLQSEPHTCKSLWYQLQKKNHKSKCVLSWVLLL